MISIKPISCRAKNRVKEHGSQFRLVSRKDKKILLESLGNTWRGEKWLGWFEIGLDVEIISP
jgi:hypothetical protein